VRRAYLDSSAFVKIVVNETESSALRNWLRGRPWTSSVLLRAEVLRAVRPHGVAAVETARKMLGLGELIRLNPALLDQSALVGPPELRTLDAIHLAAASILGSDLLALVTYDNRLEQAARLVGMRTIGPT
jgi:predicted nucleic acid-binding protein